MDNPSVRYQTAGDTHFVTFSCYPKEISLGQNPQLKCEMWGTLIALVEKLRSGPPARAVTLLLIFLIPGVGRSSSAAAGPEATAQAVQRAGARSRSEACREIVLQGEVSAGQRWSADIGQGWVFGVVPIAPSGRGYTGWDLVVGRAIAATGDNGYPDALLLGTPPYGSLNEREIGTTFGLRSQDAIAWGPRHFRFLLSARDLGHARQLFGRVMAAATNGATGWAATDKAAEQLLAMVGGAVPLGEGEFTVLDAKLTAGVANPPAFAEQWAAHLTLTPHTLLQGTRVPTPRGELHWIRFAVRLRLPSKWKTPERTPFNLTNCAE